jgi:beta-galactosidase
MKRILGCLWLLAVVVPVATAQHARITTLFDDDWRFSTADAVAPEQPQFDDSAWRRLNVPHDWSIEGPFSSTNLTGCAGAYVPAGIGWYRKHFMLPSKAAQRRFFIEFEGVMANSDVWINGFHLGHRPSGYVGFQYELTSHLNFGGRENVLVVKADNSVQPASRFYAGAGIYRHVHLLSVDAVHLEENGVFVTAPDLTGDQARVHIETTLTNASMAPRKITLRTTLLGPDGRTVQVIKTQVVITNGADTTVVQNLVVPHPQRWDLDHPKLYRVVSEVRTWWSTLDDQTTPFGLREAKFEADSGFWLNGNNFKLKGVCVHQDGGAFGAAVPMSVWERRLTALKALGVNAIRTAHNPPAPEFLDLCDRLGLLVMDEMFDCWMVGKNSLDGHKLQDYHLYFADWSQRDERDIVRRDRNHPSIIVYSAGNEIHDTPFPARAKKILTGLVAVFHENDPSRPVTQALFRPNASGDYTNGLADLLDVVGQNYRENEILAANRQVPTRKILGTENGHTRQSWVAMRDHPAYAGQFLWTGVDYLGETTRWPEIGHGSGLLDRTGNARAVGYERQSWWSDQPMVYMARRIGASDRLATDPGTGGAERYRQVLFSDWTPAKPSAQGENVEVYSNCREVELFLNDQSLGAQPLPPDAAPRVWRVPYAPGTLKAVGKNDGGSAATCELKTAGPAARIVLSNDRPTLAPAWDEVALVRATIVDDQGVPVPRVNDLISFETTGPGVIAAVDNTENSAAVTNNPNCGIQSFQLPQRHAAGGPVVAFVKATATAGQITLTASAPGLRSDSITIQVQK